jgi:hypothetical protein
MTHKDTPTPAQSPERVYCDPADVLKDVRLSPEEKIKVLQNWEDEKKALLRAEDENMMSSGGEDIARAEKMLKKIQRAEREINRSSEGP